MPYSRSPPSLQDFCLEAVLNSMDSLCGRGAGDPQSEDFEEVGSVPPSFQRLNPVLAGRILRELKERTQLDSRHLRVLLTSNLWRLDLSSCMLAPRALRLASARCGGRLSRLDLSRLPAGGEEISPPLLRKTFSSLTGLVSLNLAHNLQFRSDGLCHAVTAMSLGNGRSGGSRLEELDLTNTSVGDFSVQVALVKHCPRLTSLKLTGTLASMKAASKVLLELKHLVDFEHDDSVFAVHKAHKKDPSRHLPIRSLSLSLPDPKSKRHPVRKLARPLKGRFNEAFASAASCCSQVRSLTVKVTGECGNWERSEPDYSGIFSFLESNKSSLTELRLLSDWDVGGLGGMVVSRQLTYGLQLPDGDYGGFLSRQGGANLTTLDLRALLLVCVRDVLDFCPNLLHLRLSLIHVFRRKYRQPGSRRQPHKLRTLVLEEKGWEYTNRDDAPSHQDVVDLLSGPDLEDLTFVDSNALRDEYVLEVLTSNPFSNLRSLYINYCWNVSMDSVGPLLTDHPRPRLETVTLLKCKFLSVTEVDACAREVNRERAAAGRRPVTFCCYNGSKVKTENIPT